MLAQRVASAAVGIPIIVILIWVGGPWYAAAASLIVLLASLEFQAAHRRDGNLGFVAAGLGAAMAAGAFVGPDWVFWFTLGAVFLPLVWVTLRGDVETGLSDWQWAVSGVLYVGFLGAHLVLLRELDNGRDLVYLAVFGTFAVDTTAYFVGRRLGRRKLAPHISPGKTVEGTLGGLVGAFVLVLPLNYLLGLRLAAALIVPLAFLIFVAAVLGDLAESMLKRGMRIKDTSHAIPGHGGFLDRLDSILFVVPVVYYYVIWVVP